MKDSFSVGELASLFDLNVQTLHYYESIGLFTPLRRREGTGERIYRFDQIYRLATILFLKRLGYPLSRIKADLDSRDPESTLQRMREQSDELSCRGDELLRIRDAIDSKIRFVKEGSTDFDPEAVELRALPARSYIPIGLEESIYRSDHFYFNTTIVFYEGDSKLFGALMPAEAEMTIPGMPVLDTPALELPAGCFLVGFHRGPYDRIGEGFGRLRDAAAERGLSPAAPDSAIAINIIDQFVERDPERFLTEIEIALAPETQPSASQKA
ncbi:MAG: MerR family transcriptional regulator [Spirochaetota bacterium]